MTEFNVGNRVKITGYPNDTHEDRLVGSTGTVREVFVYANKSIGTVDYTVTLDDNHNNNDTGWIFLGTEMELINE